MDEICKFEGCKKKVRVLVDGLCGGHYQQARNGNPLRPLFKADHHKGDPCIIDWCNKPSIAKGYCGGHYNRQRLGQSMERPMERRDVELYIKNGFKYYKEKDGYVYRFSTKLEQADGYPYRIMEHRETMEGMLGRRLVGKENVHHKNGIKADNFPENLELWTRSQPAGQRVEDKIAWAKEFLTEYGYTVTDPNLLN